METGKASKTALGVAIRRAAHQLVDAPPVLDDPIAVRLIGEGYRGKMGRASHKVGRDLRAFVAARSRSAEDRLAYRNPHSGLRVFEVDFPASQKWKRELLAEAWIELPEGLRFVPLDFEETTLDAGLAEAGFDRDAAAFFGWLGVVPYLTPAAFRATLEVIAKMPAGSGVSFDYAVAPESLSAVGKKAFDALAERVAAAGEPFQLFFTPEEMAGELERVGFRSCEQLDSDHLNELYFKDREDGLKLSPVKLGRLVTAWV
jgi:O-methyltransferase involved in polyketide biosynthesis